MFNKLKQNATWILLILGSLIICLSFSSKLGRYYLQSSRNGQLYKVDKWFGKTWLLYNGLEVPVKQMSRSDFAKSLMKDEGPEEKAIDLVQRGTVMEIFRGVDGKERSEAIFVGRLIERLHDSKSKLKVLGWHAVDLDEQNFLVSYTVDHGHGSFGYFFDVNIVAKTIRFIPSFPELVEKYNLSCAPDRTCRELE